MKELKNLLKVKSILSILFSVTTCYMAIKKMINTETFMALTMAIITYYFTRKDSDNSDNNI